MIVGVVLFAVIGCQLFLRSRSKYEPDDDEHPPFGSILQYTDFEMPGQPKYGDQPPEPYGPAMPYTPEDPVYGKEGPFSPVKLQFSLYNPSTPITPFTPMSAYTPATPKTWRKEDITNYPQDPHKAFD